MRSMEKNTMTKNQKVAALNNPKSGEKPAEVTTKNYKKTF